MRAGGDYNNKTNNKIININLFYYIFEYIIYVNCSNNPFTCSTEAPLPPANIDAKL